MIPARLSIGLCAAALLAGAATAASPAAQPSRPAPAAAAARAFADGIRAEIEAVLRALEDNGDFAAARTSLEQIFDRVIAYAPLKDGALFRDAAFALRLVTFVESFEIGDRRDLFAYLRANERLASTLVFLIDPAGESPAAVLGVLNRLRREIETGRAGILNDYAALTAAICVVHDKPPEVRVVGRNAEASAVAPPPEAIFNYFRRNERSMIFPPRATPAELQVYTVNTSASIEELEWALRQYRGNRLVGQRYHDIVYDTDHLKRNTDKKVLAGGYTLQNIRRVGGVCVEQAYFAAHVGKALGVPTATVTGKGGGIGHAWVGYLESRNGAAAWNFREGRYDEFEDVRGTVRDPQSGRGISDGELSLLAQAASVSQDDRQIARAFTDAARRLARIRDEDLRYPPPAAGAPAEARPAGDAQVLELAQRAVETCAAHVQAWTLVRDQVVAGRVDTGGVKRWSEAVLRLCGHEHADFAFGMLVPMIRAVEDPREQDRLWEWAMDRFRTRPDLAGGIRLAQAALWERAGNRDRAWACYQDVVQRYCNDTPVVVDALLAAEQLLTAGKRQDMIVKLYQDAWQRIHRPGTLSDASKEQTNWFQVGRLYAQRLQEAGQAAQARNVLRQLGVDR